MIQFTVFGEPVAQARPRFSTANGFVRAYDPAKSKSFKERVYGVALEHRPQSPIDSPVAMKVDVYRSIPKSFSKKKAADAQKGTLRPTSKPDVDNFIKGVKDALKGVIWKDDSQVVTLVVSKWYSDTPRVEVTIEKAV